MIFASEETLSLIILICCIVPVAVLIVLALVLRIRNSRLSSKNGVESAPSLEEDKEQRANFLDAYGGEDNVLEISLERSKISVKVKEVDKVNGDRLKELGAVNVIIIGNEVRSSYSDRASSVYELIK